MIRKFYIATLLILISLNYSCETNPPTFADLNSEMGKIIITSNVDGAQIYLDNIFTGKYTPDTIEANIGAHEIKLIKDVLVSNNITIMVEKGILKDIFIELNENSIKKVVLLEDFANVSCDPCVLSNSIIRKMHLKYGSRIAVIKFSTNFPSPNDPFYLANTTMNNSRMSYYNILFAPTVIIDGISRPIPTDSTDIINDIDSRLNISPKFKIESMDSLSEDGIHIKVSLEKLTNDLDQSEFRIYSAVVEKEKLFNLPPGSNGETDFFDVVRTLMPNSGGCELNVTNSSQKYEFFTEFLNEWEKQDLYSVTFIQNILTGEILQSTSTLKE